MKSNQKAMLSFFVKGRWGDEYEFDGSWGRGVTMTNVRQAVHECYWDVTDSTRAPE